ncbi:MAG: hypothetical protein U0174_14960 [Polyangiaceae bacterium]
MRVLVVNPPPDFDPEREPFEVVNVDELEVPHLQNRRFRYNAQQFCGMLKSWLIRKLMGSSRRRDQRLVYIDALSLLAWNLDNVSALLDQHRILIAPHVSFPVPDDGRHKNEQDFLRSGTYISGFLALRSSPAARALIDFWSDRVLEHCMPERGIAANDQKWFALIPSMFPHVGILRTPGHNLAYWNVQDRTLSKRRGRWFLGEHLVRIVHFSGYEPERPTEITRYPNDRSPLADRPDLVPLYESYRKELVRHGYETLGTFPYGYDTFDNGVAISPLVRRFYGELTKPERFGDPFETAPSRSFYRWMLASPKGRSARSDSLPPLWKWIYEQSSELQRFFPDVGGRNRQRFLLWAREQGTDALDLPAELAPR